MVTELATGLGMLGAGTLEESLLGEPREMVSVSPELWGVLRDLHQGGALRAEFQAAFANGRAFLRASDALRSRTPEIVEWKGATRAPGDEVVPADLRIDHVYLVSCKYLSKIVLNTSPWHVFDRLLTGGHGQVGGDWYQEVASEALEKLYRSAVLGSGDEYPPTLDSLSAVGRKGLARQLRGRWPLAMRAEAREFAWAVATASVNRWSDVLVSDAAREKLLWRLLRIGSAPYFVLGTDKDSNLRLRIQTPWDWKQQFRLVQFRFEARPSEQPVIDWVAVVEDIRSRVSREVRGHVEIRWSHGKFNGNPEAKVYLDTPHHRVPGYVELR